MILKKQQLFCLPSCDSAKQRFHTSFPYFCISVEEKSSDLEGVRINLRPDIKDLNIVGLQHAK